MGIVLKRRDNAPLLKMIYGGAIDRLLNARDVVGAVKYVEEKVQDLVEGRIKLSQLTITKSLAADYAGTPPAHKMLADRIAARDPGNAPSSGDRIGFVYVKPAAGQMASKLQGDRVETPAWIEEKGLKADAEYYIDHQLMNPLAQLFGILLESMPGFVPPARWAVIPEKLIAQRELLAGELLFRRGLQACRSAAAVDFVTKMGGSVPKATAAAAKAARPRTVKTPLLDAELAAVMPKKQTTMDMFIKQTALMTDSRLAREMLKEKKSRKAASSAASASAAAAKAEAKTP